MRKGKGRSVDFHRDMRFVDQEKEGDVELVEKCNIGEPLSLLELTGFESAWKHEPIP